MFGIFLPQTQTHNSQKMLCCMGCRIERVLANEFGCQPFFWKLEMFSTSWLALCMFADLATATLSHLHKIRSTASDASMLIEWIWIIEMFKAFLKWQQHGIVYRNVNIIDYCVVSLRNEDELHALHVYRNVCFACFFLSFSEEIRKTHVSA